MNRIQLFIRQYAWFLAKNVLGWALILGSMVLGPLLPGPGGIPMFLVGFALITFPGKRRLTSHVLRGRSFHPSKRYRRLAVAIWLILPAPVAWAGSHIPAVERWAASRGISQSTFWLGGYFVIALFALAVLRLGPYLVNCCMPVMPRIRRTVRPMLRHLGIHLLPPRRHGQEEILRFHESWRARVSETWKKLRPWLPKMIGLIVVPVIFYRLITPIHAQWATIVPYLSRIRWDMFALACLMFATNQYFCRVISWRGVLKGLGYRLPVAASARIWASSELARYIPGTIWQMVGRAFLARPYGLPMTTCSISQVLELVLLLLANIIVAVGTLSLLGSRISEEARPFLRFATILLPCLVAFVHPKVFYPVVNFILRKVHKPLIETQLTGVRLVSLLLLAIAGQAWLGLALWIATHSILGIALNDAWMLSGAYCLAWSAGFCMASIAPSGIGIREAVLGGTLYLVLPTALGSDLDPHAKKALFAAIALMLRLWAAGGELIFAGFAYLWDFDGARGKITPVEAVVVSPD